VTKELALQQGGYYGRAVYNKEWMLLMGTVTVNRLGDELFPRTCLSFYKNCHTVLRQRTYGLEDLFHVLAGPYNLPFLIGDAVSGEVFLSFMTLVTFMARKTLLSSSSTSIGFVMYSVAPRLMLSPSYPCHEKRLS